MADNLLDKASILLTPTAYDNGRMLSVKPNENLYGSELVTNGDFATDTDWSKTGTWSISNGQASANANSTSQYVQQDFTITNGKTYLFTYEIIENTLNGNGAALSSVGGFGSVAISNVIGTHQVYITATNSSATNVLMIGVSATCTTGTIKIDNVSVVEDLSGDFNFERNSAATRVNAQGLVENVQIISSELVSNGNFSQIGTEEVLNGNFSQQGSELVTNGDFATDSDWNIVNNTGAASEIINGYARIKTDGAYTQIDQPNVTIAAKSYKLQYTISESDGGSLGFIITGNQTASIPTTVGTHIYYFVANSTSIVFKRFSGVLDVKIDNVSVKEVGENWDLGTGWSIGEDKAISDGSQSTISDLEQNITLNQGSIYLVEFDLIRSAGTLYPKVGDTTGTGLTSTQSVSQTIVAGSSNKLELRADVNFIGSITNISVKEVGQDWSVIDGDADNYVEFNQEQGTARLKFLNTSPITNLRSTAQYVGGKKYKLIVDVAEVVSGGIKIDAGGVSQTYNSVGIQEAIIEPTGTSVIYFYRATSNVDITLNSVSLKEITDDTNIPRINYEGFSYQDTLGSQLIVNGDFATDSNWTKGTGWSIANGKASRTAQSGSTSTYQSVYFTANKSYKITYDLDINAGSFLLRIGGGTLIDTTIRTTSGTYTEYIVANSGNNVLNLRAVNGAFIGSIDNVSVKEYLGQEVVPDSGCGSWLLEPQRTNSLLQSNQFDTTWSTSNVAITSGQIGVGGSLDAWKLESSGSSASFIFQGISTSVVTTRSIYAKAGSVNWVSINSGGSQSAYFDLSNGVVGTKSSNIIDATMESVGDGWYRCSVEIDSQSNFYVFVANADNSQVSNSGDSIYIQYAQLEEGSYPTSYIPTSGSIVTRLADQATNSGNSSLINSTEGVLYAEIAALADENSSRYFSINDGSTNNRIRFGYTASNNVRLLVVASSVQVDITEQLSNTSVFNKIAIKYKQNDFALWVNGVEIATDTSGNTPIGLSQLDFDNAGGGDKFYGKAKALAVYKEALTDANLRSLTYPNPVATTFDLDFDTIAEQFTFTRGSEATFVNAQGLIESTNQIGSELVTNGDFSTDSNWNKGTGWSISGGKANVNSTSFTDLSQNIGAVVGKTYKISFEVSNYVSGSVKVILGYGSSPELPLLVATSNGVYEVETTPNAINPQNIYISTKTTNTQLSIDNVSVKEYTTATNTPRIDYSTGAKAFLLEPQSTNLFLQSEIFTSWNGYQATSNTTASPDGNSVLFLDFEDARMFPTTTISSSTEYTSSIYLKANKAADVKLRNAADLDTVISLTTNWVRYELTGTSVSTSTNALLIDARFSQGLGASGLEIALWGAQIEQQSYSTSYIPTSGASATRNQELCNNATPVINSEEGTLYAEISALADDSSVREIALSDGSSSNRIELRYGAASNRIQLVARSGGVVQASISSSNYNILLNNKVAVKYKANDFALWINGVKVGTDVSGNTPVGLSELAFDDGDGGSNFYGNTKGLKYYPKALADVQLEDLTTI